MEFKAGTLLSVVSPVQLGKTDQITGTIFRKQIMSYGQWVNPNWWWDDEIWMELNEELADQMIENFNNKTYGKRISVPLNHTGDVTANAGEVIKLEKGPGGMWAYLDIRDEDTVAKLEKGLIFDVSMGFDWDYVSQKDGRHYGATLFHVALVTDPYLNDMDDFSKVDEMALSKRFDEWAPNIGFGTEQKSIIMMSKSKVEEMKSMKKLLAKITNDKEYPVEVTYKDADGKEVTETVEAGKEIEVPKDAETEVTKQISESEAPADDDADDKPEDVVDDDDVVEDTQEETAEDAKAELSRLRLEKAEWSAEKAYSKLLSAGKIVPAQKELFMSIAKASADMKVTMSADIVLSKKVTLAKGKATSVITLLSAILNAGPKVLELGEKGKDGAGEGVEAKLTPEQEEKVKSMGFSVEKFNKHLAKGTIKLSDLEK